MSGRPTGSRPDAVRASPAIRRTCSCAAAGSWWSVPGASRPARSSRSSTAARRWWWSRRRRVPRSRAWAEAGRLVLHERAFRAGDLDGAWLAFTATDDPAVNAAVHAGGRDRRVWVNSADDPANCSFTLMSVIRRGDLVVSVGTGGRSPALAAHLAESIWQRRSALSTRPCSTSSPKRGKGCGARGVHRRTPTGNRCSTAASLTWCARVASTRQGSC